MTIQATNATSTGLKKTIGLYGAVTLALGIVIGAGMLSLPGLVYRETGGWAVWAWVLDGLLVLPLLFVFALLGRRFPSAGGVAGFVGAAFPGLKVGCSYLLVGTFSLGLPAIALTGAGYVASSFGVTEAENGLWPITAIAAAIVVGVLGMAWLGGKFAGTVQNIVVTLLVGCLAFVALSSMPYWETIDFTVGDPTWLTVWSGMGLAFFAYTGWEMLAFTAEEFKNPRRDFPLAVAISFVAVLALYLGAALAVQALVPLDDPRAITAPLLAVIEITIGNGVAAAALAAIVLAIIVTNLNGAAWAASRLIFDIGRSGWAPKKLALHRLEGDAATPRPAIFCLGLLLGAALLVFGVGWLDLSDLLRLAGQNFFLLYTLSIVAYLKIESRPMARVFGLVTLAVCLVFAGVFGWGLLYALGLFALPYAVRTAAVAKSAVIQRIFTSSTGQSESLYRSTR